MRECASRASVKHIFVFEQFHKIQIHTFPLGGWDADILLCVVEPLLLSWKSVKLLLSLGVLSTTVYELAAEIKIM